MTSLSWVISGSLRGSRENLLRLNQGLCLRK